MDTGVAESKDHRGFLDYHAGPAGGDATRHLCAAAHLDRRFRTRAIEELVENKHRVPAATPGVDMARVLAECLLARRDAVIAGLLVFVVAVGGLLLAPADTVAAVAAVLSARALVWLLKLIRTAIGSGRRASFAGRNRGLRSLMMLALLFFGLPLVASVIGLPILLSIAASRSSSGGSLLSSGSGLGSSGAGGSAGTAPSGWGALLVLALWVLIGSVARYRRHSHLAALHTGRSAEAWFPHFEPLFTNLRNRPAEAETLYSDFEPFVGAGMAIEDKAWSFPVELAPNAEHRDTDTAPRPLHLPDMHRALTAGLNELAAGRLYPGDLLRRLTVRDRVFRSGVRADHPAQWYRRLSVVTPGGGPAIEPSIADLLDYGSHERIRHYLEARVELWEGQIVAAVFLRAYIQGGLLQVEGVPFVLPPIAERYRVVDGVLPPEPLSDGAAAFARSVRSFALDAVTSVIEPCLALRSVVRARLRSSWYLRMIGAGRPVDHGPRLSLRELGSEPVYQQLFQEVDVHRFFVSVRQRASTAVLAELSRAGYATSEFERMAQTINSQVNLFGANASVGIGNIQNINNGGSQYMTGQQSTGAGADMRQSSS